jgi:hypothetical protein
VSRRYPRRCPPGTTADNFDFRALDQEAVGEAFDVEFERVGFWDLRFALADAYRAGRVFIAGDAAHSHPPYGGVRRRSRGRVATDAVRGATVALTPTAASTSSAPIAMRDGARASRRVVRAGRTARRSLRVDGHVSSAGACPLAELVSVSTGGLAERCVAVTNEGSSLCPRAVGRPRRSLRIRRGRAAPARSV